MHIHTSRRIAAALTTAAITVPLGVLGASSAQATQAPDSTSTVSARAAAGPAITADAVIDRASRWLTANNGGAVPYSQTTFWNGQWRQDCSGYASMALRLDANPNTQALADPAYGYTTAIAQLSNLRKGDLLIDANGSSTTRHVVIFEKWVEGSGKHEYWAYEQRGTYGTTHRKLTYGLPGGDQAFKPYRPTNITG